MTTDDFTISVNDTDDGVEIAVGGELDILTTPQLRAALERAAGQRRHVVLDLAEVTFIDSTALHALLNAERALAAGGRQLRLENPSPIVTRALTLAGLAGHFDASARPDAPAPTAAHPPPTEAALGTILQDMALLLLTEGSLRADLGRLIQFACDTMPSCDLASVALLIDGHPSTVAASGHVAVELDIAQYDSAEGPCLEALHGAPVRVDVLDADDRFTHFASGAADHRIHSVLSIPVIHRADVVGTLNFYAHAANAFDDVDATVAQIAASQVAHAIVRSDVVAAAHQLRDRLQVLYDEATVAGRAQGVLSALHNCSAEQAHRLLASVTTASATTLTATARRIADIARANRSDHTA